MMVIVGCMVGDGGRLSWCYGGVFVCHGAMVLVARGSVNRRTGRCRVVVGSVIVVSCAIVLWLLEKPIRDLLEWF